MEKKITETKWFCDICGRESSSRSTCELCGKEYCYVCEFIGYNPLHINICKAHQKDDLMKEEMAKIANSYKTMENKLITKLKKAVMLGNLEENEKI